MAAMTSVLLVGPVMADEPLAFTSELSAGSAHALANMLAASGKSELDFVSAHADFNSDGRQDVLAFAMDSYFCGSGGCGPRLYISTKKGWKEVPFYGLGSPENWYLLDSTENGYRKIAYLEDDAEHVFVFDGEAYDDAE